MSNYFLPYFKCQWPTAAIKKRNTAREQGDGIQPQPETWKKSSKAKNKSIYLAFFVGL
jgi:hypothetical protein